MARAISTLRRLGGTLIGFPESGFAGAFTDSTGLTPVTALNDVVGKINDRVGTNHATQATTASKPLVARVPKRLGPNLVVNGDFSSGTGWNPGAGWVISGGVATATATTVNINQSITFAVGKSYQVTFDATITSGNIRAEAGLSFGSTLAATGRYSTILAPTGGDLGKFYIYGPTALTGTIDNITVQEVLEWSNALDFDGSNDLLTLGGSAILQQGSDHFVTAAFVLDVVTGSQTIYSSRSTSTTNPLVCVMDVGPLGQVVVYWRDDAGVLKTVASVNGIITAGVPCVLTATKVGSTGRVFLNGVSVATADISGLGATTVNAGAIGAQVSTTTTNYLNGKIIDTAIGQGTLTDNDRRTIERAMAQKAGVTL
jgi:hypothetical protein